MPTKKARYDRGMEILAIDLQTKANTTAHHTSLYETQKYVVLRWGNTFTFNLKLSESFDSKDYSINAEFTRGSRPRFSRGTKFVTTVGEKATKYYYSWKGELKVINDKEVSVSIALPDNGPIGAYDLMIEIVSGSSIMHSLQAEKQLVILFNPWNKNSGVYMESADERQEYVLNETGMMWAGTQANMHIWHWNFAQLEEVCLDASLFLLDEKDIDSDDRRNPMMVARTLAEMVNINDDDNGVLWGNWSSNDKDYADGTDPTAWSGSQAILTEYMSTKRPVKYAQCWVFGGTLTTVLRAVGIPARPITNYDSAHDTEANKTIDYYYDKDWNLIEDKSADSIWNYHVWVDAWMDRPDLTGNYSGWQAVDATPQEISMYSGTMVVGPASVRAIKEGIDMKYDNLFVISEVNADILTHFEEKDGKSIVVNSNTTEVGSLIATKKVGRDALEDITLEYKFREGTVEERAAAAVKATSDVKYTLVPEQGVGVGRSCTFTITMKTTLSESMTVELALKANSVTYIGSVGELIKQDKITKTVNKAAGTVTVRFTVSDKDYVGKLSNHAMLQCSVFAHVKGKDQYWVGKVTQQFAMPTMLFSFPSGSSKAKKGKPFNVVCSFNNPLNTSITNIEWIVEGAGLIKPDIVKTKGSVDAGKKVEKRFTLTPTEGRDSRRTLVVTCNCTQLKGVMGTTVITVSS